MLKKTSFYMTTLVIGMILLASSFAFRSEALKSVNGICLGIGMGLIGMSIANLWMKRYEKKNPDIAKQNKVEFNDERNKLIRYKARAKAGEILQWCI